MATTEQIEGLLERLHERGCNPRTEPPAPDDSDGIVRRKIHFNQLFDRHRDEHGRVHPNYPYIIELVVFVQQRDPELARRICEEGLRDALGYPNEPRKWIRSLLFAGV